MSARPAPALRRDPEHRVVAGVCAGNARHFGIDPLVVRVAFMAASFAGGLGFVAYGAAWLVMPAGEGGAARRRLAGRPAVEVALGAGLLVLSALLTFRALGVWFSDALVWPLVLVVAGGALLWRESLGRADAPETEAAEPEPPAAAVTSRTGLGIALVIGAGLAFLGATNALSAARNVVLSVLVVAVVLAVIFFPWILRLARSLAAERAARLPPAERAEMAAHPHHPVLQTLARLPPRPP